MSEKKQVIAAISSVMKAVAYVFKAGKNEFHGYKYATEGDALNGLRPHLIENGIVIIPDVISCSGPDEYGNTTVAVRYSILHTSGEEITSTFYGCGNDRNKNGIGDKGLYKAMTGANKYFLLKTFLIETGDDPERDENQAAEFQAPAKVATKPAPAPAPTPKTNPEPVAAQQEDLDVDSLIKQISDELAHCSSKDEARQVWGRYKSHIAQVKLQAPNREQELTNIFTTHAKKLK
jgi:hypothetical protein